MKKLETLPQDIFALFDPNLDHEVNEDNLDVFAEELKKLIRQRLKKQKPSNDRLRFSMLGRPDRQVWFRANSAHDAEQLKAKDQFKFLYGDLLECVLLLLSKEAGHEVTDEQREVECDGVKGHIDCKIDGVVVDIKSASPFGFKKFKLRTVEQDDPFGYVQQLAGYGDVLTPNEDAAWLAFDKVHGDICITPLSKHSISHYPPLERIRHLKSVIDSPDIPPLCYNPVPDGKSGNLKLPVGCSYCAFKFKCYPNLRTFVYSSGPVFLTHVARVPNVLEVTQQIEIEED